MDNHAFIIEMGDKLCDQVVYIFLDLGSNYSYVKPDLEDKCDFRKKSACRVLVSAVG